jgi:hypothetical protein
MISNEEVNRIIEQAEYEHYLDISGRAECFALELGGYDE